MGRERPGGQQFHVTGAEPPGVKVTLPLSISLPGRSHAPSRSIVAVTAARWPSRTVPLPEAETKPEPEAFQVTVPPRAEMKTVHELASPAPQPVTVTVGALGVGDLDVGRVVVGRLVAGRDDCVGAWVVGGVDVGVSVGRGVSLGRSSLGETLADEESVVPTIAPCAGVPFGLSEERGR